MTTAPAPSAPEPEPEPNMWRVELGNGSTMDYPSPEQAQAASQATGNPVTPRHEDPDD